jgi:hypothetical protein
MTEIEQIEPTDIFVFWTSRGRLSTTDSAGNPGKEFVGWATGAARQSRTDV